MTSTELGFTMIFGSILLIFLIPLFLYLAKITYEIAKYEGRTDAYLAWIPIANVYLICKMARISFIVWILLNFITITLSPTIIISFSWLYFIYGYNKIFKRYSVNQITMNMSYVVHFCFLICLGQCYSNLKKMRVNNLNNGYGGNFNNYNTFNNYNDNNNYNSNNDYNNGNY